MAFATISSDLSYWHKQSKPLFDNLIWNIPEQKPATSPLSVAIAKISLPSCVFPNSSTKLFLSKLLPPSCPTPCAANYHLYQISISFLPPKAALLPNPASLNSLFPTRMLPSSLATSPATLPPPSLSPTLSLNLRPSQTY